MTPILYEKDEIEFTSHGLGDLTEIYDVDIHEQRNGLLQLTASYPVSGISYDDISVGRVILAKPNQRDDNHAFRIVRTELDISGYAITIEADSITYDLTHNLVKHLNVNSSDGQTFMNSLQNAIVNPSIFTFYSDVSTVSTTKLDYINPMEAIMGTTGSFLQFWGGELKRENRRVAMFNRRGRDNVATFRLGKNISGLKYSVDISSLVTRIIPTKSVQNDDQTTTTLEGTPVDSQYINNYEQIYTLPLEFTDDAIKTVADLNAAAKGWFTQSANIGRDKPTVTIDIDVLSLQDSADYQDKFKNLESVSLTDTVTVYVPEYGVNVTAIVNELHYDPILDRVTKMSVGTAKQSFADSSRTQLSDLQDKIISVQNQADAVAVSANGKNKNYYGSVQPSHPQEGDLWYWINGDQSGIKQFVNGDWVDLVDSDTQEKIAASVTEAVSQAKSHTDEVKQGLSSDIDTAKSQAASQASAAEASAKSAATSQFTQAQNALSAAKTDLTNSIASEASARNQAVAAANSQAQTYANQAKADAMSAASSADGVIRTAISSSDDSLSATITQNKSSADSGISTAQTTAQQAVDGLTLKVSKTDYDQKTGDLSTKINDVKETADSSAQTIADIKTADGKQDARMSEIENTASGIKSTVSDLSTAQGKQSGYISTLQQRADGFDATVSKINTTVNSLGQVNQLFNTEFSPDFQGWFIRGAYGQDISKGGWVKGYPVNGHGSISHVKQPYVGNLQSPLINATGANKISISAVVSVYSDDGVGNSYITLDAFNQDGTFVSQIAAVFIQNGASDKYIKLENITIPSDVSCVSLGMLTPSATVTYKLSQPMLVFASTVGAYVQGNYNNNGAIAKAQLAADNAALAISDYKTNADGRISQAQADITATAKQVATKVSQTDYDKKTGDLTTAVSKAQTTADGVVTTVGNYKTSNDKRVQAAESAISQNADAIALKVAKTDYDSNNSQLNTRFTKVEATANGASTTVSDLQQTVNDLGQVNLVVNSEINPDLAGWAFRVQAAGAVADNSSQGYSGHGALVIDTINPTTSSQDSYYSSQLMPVFEKQVTISYRVRTNVVGSIVNVGVAKATSDGVIYGGDRSSVTTTGDWQYIQRTISLDDKTSYIAFDIMIPKNVQARTVFSQPMINVGARAGAYVSGQYNNNAALAQVKITADGISNFVRDSSGNISSNFQTALSKTSIITGSTLASSIQTQTSSQITSALTDNNGKIISLINQDSSGVQIAGKNITLDGNTTVTGDFYAKGGNFKNLNASEIKTGTINASLINVINLNASNITTGAINGANLTINLDTGQVVFQKGRIYSADGRTDINIDSGYISTANSSTRILLTNGQMQFVDPTVFSQSDTPYFKISNDSGIFNGSGALVSGKDTLTLGLIGQDSLSLSNSSGTETFYGINLQTSTNMTIGGANQGLYLSGGATFDDSTTPSGKNHPYIFVGSDSYGGTSNGNRVYISSRYMHSPAVYQRTNSASANVYVSSDGALVRSSSASRFKLNIEYETDASTAEQLLTLNPATWDDKFETEQTDRLHETGEATDIAINKRRYYGIIAEDLVKANLDYLVQRNEQTNEVDGVEYAKIGVALIPIVRELRDRINEQALEIERLKEMTK